MGHRHSGRLAHDKKSPAFVRRLEITEGLELAREADLSYTPSGLFLRYSNDELGQKSGAQSSQGQHDLDGLEEAQRRMFGEEIGDEVSFCGPMLDAVVSLPGDVDCAGHGALLCRQFPFMQMIVWLICRLLSSVDVQELIKLGILSDDLDQHDQRPLSQLLTSEDDVLPRFRSRSQSTSGDHDPSSPCESRSAVLDNDENGFEDDWELMGSTTWESGSEAWELLGEDS
ncbi:MAG: hypothetical protein M1815_001511 [Lichina confinis]|nr:MAG: hypothetical protein M1815_001511 [Lichina confinis]